MVPAFRYSIYLTLYKTDISLRRTLTTGPRGVRLSESWLYFLKFPITLQIDSVEAKGADAPPMPTGFTEMERTYIALGIAVGILAIFICILIVVVSHQYNIFICPVFNGILEDIAVLVITYSLYPRTKCIIKKCKTTTYQKSFLIRSSRIWNCLADEVDLSSSTGLASFKSVIFNYYKSALAVSYDCEDPRSF